MVEPEACSGVPTVQRAGRLALVGGIVFAATLFAWGGWDRRWIADDGLTVLRTVRNLLAGNGPVFNVGERVEVNTSAAWTYLIWFFGWLTHARLEYVVLGIALALSVSAIVFAMLGAARLWGVGGRLLCPVGAVVYIALPPARDYATSGLESSLVICWLAVLWWWLIRWSRIERVGLAGFFGVAFWAGLAPLIRPELTLVGAAALLILLCAPLPGNKLRPLLIRGIAVLVSGLLPVSYQIWRMGYYGLPYPNTAVAKDASGSKWRQGSDYLWNFVEPYRLWVPLLALGVAGALTVWSRRNDGAARISGAAKPALRERVHLFRRKFRSPAAVVVLMLGSGAMLIGYEIRVGGDFMHGRMLLPQLFCLLLPVMVLPLSAPGARRLVSMALVAGTVGWALFAADATAITSGSRISAAGIADERLYYIQTTGRAHPIRAEDYLGYPRLRPMLRAVADSPNGGLLINSPSFTAWHLVPPPHPAGHTVFYVNLGMISMNMPLDVRVLDPMGLAYPLAAHTFRFPDARIGHDKNLDADWALVDAGMVDRHPRMPWFLGEDWVTRIRTAIRCPETQDLLASARAPLTAERFRRNVFRSWDYARYRIDRVPEFELERCRLG
ncbi:flagellar motor control protein ZomB [Nocardia goodfellowii]